MNETDWLREQLTQVQAEHDEAVRTVEMLRGQIAYEGKQRGYYYDKYTDFKALLTTAQANCDALTARVLDQDKIVAMWENDLMKWRGTLTERDALRAKLIMAPFVSAELVELTEEALRRAKPNHFEDGYLGYKRWWDATRAALNATLRTPDAKEVDKS